MSIALNASHILSLPGRNTGTTHTPCSLHAYSIRRLRAEGGMRSFANGSTYRLLQATRTGQIDSDPNKAIGRPRSFIGRREAGTPVCCSLKIVLPATNSSALPLLVD
jgi:hypothetical protein